MHSYIRINGGLFHCLAFFFPLFLLSYYWYFCLSGYLFRTRYVAHFLVMPAHGLAEYSCIFRHSALAKHDFSQKDSSSLRIMTWNVRSWDEFTTKKLGFRPPVANAGTGWKTAADVLCFQEFYEPADTAKSNIRYIQRELHFPYYYFSTRFSYQD